MENWRRFVWVYSTAGLKSFNRHTRVCVCSGDATECCRAPWIIDVLSLHGLLLLSLQFGLNQTRHIFLAAQVAFLFLLNAVQLRMCCNTVTSQKEGSVFELQFWLGCPGAVWVIFSTLVLRTRWPSSFPDAKFWPGGSWMASTTWAQS